MDFWVVLATFQPPRRLEGTKLYDTSVNAQNMSNLWVIQKDGTDFGQKIWPWCL